MIIRFLVFNIWGMGGTSRTVCNLADYLVEKEYKVEIISVRRTSDKPMLPLSKKIKIISLYDARYEENKNNSLWKKWMLKRKSKMIHKEEDLYGMFSLYTDLKLLKCLKNIKDGVLITTIPSFNMLSVKHAGKNVIKIGQEHKELEDHSEKIVHIIEKYYKDLDGLTILTEESLPDYKNLTGNGKLPICVLGNGTKMVYHKAPLDRKVIISAGRFSPEKGFDNLVNAFDLIADKHKEWIVKIFGQGEEYFKLEKMIGEKGLNERIFLCPSTKILTEELSRSAFYVCSSNREGFGMIIIEGMAIGVPCVSFACQGPKQIISDGIDGFLVEKGDILGLAEKMELMMESFALREEMGEKALQKAQKYSIEKVGEKMEELMVGLI
ncbi:MAG: glycosyltransferase family 4 protein [Lachnospiraceae bacterium]|nr:glycosyltransferase family 4 protein [Lachnospiraceae bacterium]